MSQFIKLKINFENIKVYNIHCFKVKSDRDKIHPEASGLHQSPIDIITNSAIFLSVKDFLKKIDYNKVEEKLKKLKDSKLFGADGVHQLILKTCAESIAKPLKIIFEKSIKEGKLPEWWKRANVTPIFKKRCRSDRKNYRMVSLISIICKILDSFVRDGIMD